MKNKEEKIENRKKRKISIITCFLWIFLVITMGIVIIDGIDKSRALEETVEVPTLELGEDFYIYINFRNSNNKNIYRYTLKDYSKNWFTVGDVIENNGNYYYSYKCTVKLNKEKINEIICSSFLPDDCYYNSDFDETKLVTYWEVLDEATMYYSKSGRWEFWDLGNSSYGGIELVIPITVNSAVRQLTPKNLNAVKVEFKCEEEHNKVYNPKDINLDNLFIIGDIEENNEDQILNEEIILKENIPYKCNIKLNYANLDKIVDFYNEENKDNEEIKEKHYYYSNFNIDMLDSNETMNEITLYWYNGDNEYSFWNKDNVYRWCYLDKSGNEIEFVVPIKEEIKVEKEVTLSYNENIDKNEEKIEVPESKTQKVYDGEAAVFVISDMIPERNGYKFLGWSNNSGKNNVDYNVGENIYLTKNKIIYAVWEENKQYINKYGSYKVKHEYYVKDEKENIKLEDTYISNVIENIEVGKKVGVSSEDEIVDIEINMELIHKIDDKEYTYKYLENSGNIVIEENMEKEIIIKYIRDITDESNILDNNVDTSDINIWLYVAIFVIAEIVIIVIFMVLKNK